MPQQQVDTIIDAGWVVPVEPAGAVLVEHSVAIGAGRIVAVLPSATCHATYRAARVVSLPEDVLIPGLINLHTHAAMTLLRGIADDLPLMQWLSEHIWPAEAKNVSRQFVYDGSLLACAEMLRGGTTCFSDMYFFPEAAAEAVLAAKMRACIGIIAIEFASSYASDAADYLHKGLATRDAFRDEASLRFTLAPHAPYTVSDKTFERIATLAAQLDIPIQTHLHETQDEITQSVKEFGVRPLARMRALDLLGPNFIATHAVHLQPDEIELLARYGCHVAHCPTSNLKLASGFAPVAKLIGSQANVGIGTDGCASNNRLDMFAEMRLAALLAKGVAQQADAVPAQQALAMATINSARALGLDGEIGSLSPGKRADLVAVHLGGLDTLPCYDVISHLVYVAGRDQVSHVWVNGAALLEEQRFTQLDSNELRARAQSWQQRIAQ